MSSNRRLPYKQLPRRVFYEQSGTLIGQKLFTTECTCQSYENSNKELDFDSRVQNAIDRMAQQIFKLKNELDDEKSKSKVLSEKIDHIMTVFGSISRV